MTVDDGKSIFDFRGTEISSRSGVKVEGDKRLDKLESFLDKLHNKGSLVYFPCVFLVLL